MNVGVFLLIEPFASVETQLIRAKEMGFTHADITDTNSGGSMLGSAGFSPTVSLDANPFDVLRLFQKYEMTPSTVCAHACLLEPSNPGIYGTAEIMKAVQFAAAIGVKDVVTSEMDPRSEWAESLTPEIALRRAVAAAADGRPVVVNETSDNPGGGTPGDATHVLQAMMLESETPPVPRMSNRIEFQAR